jgi:acyl-CoA synthetase (AMP-forming)/AMP-acid ligase II
VASTLQDFTLATMIRTLAEEGPDRPALTCDGRTTSFGELDRRSSQVANAMLAAGVGPGDRVALVTRNCTAYYEVMLAAAKIGAVQVGINFRLAAPEVAAIVDDAHPKLMFVGPELMGLVPAGTEAVALDGRYETWFAGASDVGPIGGAGPDDVAIQLYSSGTTGAPKGAMLTNANLSWTPRMGREFYEMSASSVNLVTSPLFHVGGTGYSLTGLGQGAHTIITADLDPGNVLALIERHAVTHAFFVPTVIRLLLDRLATRPTDLSSLEVVAYGAAPIDDRTLLEAIAAFDCRFLGVYGMTETAGSVTSLAFADHDPGGPRSHLLRSVGKPLPWHEVVVVDPAVGQEAPAGAVGEIWVRSPQNMAGYWGQPELTAATLSGDGWLRTGDAAWRDEDGYLYIVDRLKDMVITGGENVYPAEVERVLLAHPAVREAVVVGVPDRRWGETVKAVVVVSDGAAVTGGELIAFTRERLAHYKCPTSVDFVGELVRNASGKVLKRVIRDGYRLDAREGVTP